MSPLVGHEAPSYTIHRWADPGRYLCRAFATAPGVYPVEKCSGCCNGRCFASQSAAFCFADPLQRHPEETLTLKKSDSTLIGSLNRLVHCWHHPMYQLRSFNKAFRTDIIYLSSVAQCRMTAATNTIDRYRPWVFWTQALKRTRQWGLLQMLVPQKRASRAGVVFQPDGKREGEC